MTEDETLGRDHQLTERKVVGAPRDGGGQGGLACCSPWGRKESDTTERLNNNNKGLTRLRDGRRVKVSAEPGQGRGEKSAYICTSKRPVFLV